MSLIAMCCYDTVENQRTQYTRQTLLSLQATVDLHRHRVIIVDNASCGETKQLLRTFANVFQIITLPENVGTAGAINEAWKLREPGENAVKMDNDVVIHYKNWIDVMDDAIERDHTIGIIGLKRKDCAESPHRTDWAHSRIEMLRHQPGQRWIVVEEVAHVMGTCQMYNSHLLDRIGYLYQPRLYGFDDALAAVRCKVAGYRSVFLPCIEIDHIDPGDTPYQKWKEKSAAEDMNDYYRLVAEYRSGKTDVYYNPFV